MASFTVHKGKRYQAFLKLSFLQQVASNEMVAGKFREVGFEDVEAGGLRPQTGGQGILAPG